MGVPIFNPEAPLPATASVLAAAFVGAGVLIQLGLLALARVFRIDEQTGWGDSALLGVFVGVISLAAQAGWATLLWLSK